MQRRKTGKISIFNSLDVIFDFLMSRVENSNRVSTRDQYQAESKCWNRVFESSQKIDIEYSNRVRRLILKLNLTISLDMKTWFNNQFSVDENSAWWLFWSCNVLTLFKLYWIEISWLFWLLFEHGIESKDS